MQGLSFFFENRLGQEFMPRETFFQNWHEEKRCLGSLGSLWTTRMSTSLESLSSNVYQGFTKIPVITGVQGVPVPCGPQGLGTEFIEVPVFFGISGI